MLLYTCECVLLGPWPQEWIKRVWKRVLSRISLQEKSQYVPWTHGCEPVTIPCKGFTVRWFANFLQLIFFCGKHSNNILNQTDFKTLTSWSSPWSCTLVFLHWTLSITIRCWKKLVKIKCSDLETLCINPLFLSSLK